MACTLSNKCAKIFLNGQFYFNLSSKMWSHVFLEHSVVCIGKQHSIYDLQQKCFKRRRAQLLSEANRVACLTR